jgi:hypothetical protein
MSERGDEGVLFLMEGSGDLGLGRGGLKVVVGAILVALAVETIDSSLDDFSYKLL